MKTLWLTGVLSLSITSGIMGQNAFQSTNSELPAPTPYAVASRDANSSVWQSTTYEQGPDGEAIPHVHQYNEVATGLNFKDPDTGEWEPSTETIEQYPGGAIAQHGQAKVIFADDLATFGAIDMEMPDGHELRSHLLGLCYYDTASGQSVFIAQVTNCVGQLISSNQIWYDNAFDTLKAGVRYTYTRQGFEQDIIMEECPPMPEAYGLNSSSTVLQALTEFISPPTPAISTNFYPSTLGAEEMDQSLQFSTMKIGRGRAFLMDDDTEGTPVCKEWLALDGRQFLVEEVPVSEIAARLQTLPSTQIVSLKRVGNSAVNVVSRKRLLPAAPPVARASTRRMRIANLSRKQSGFVLDYTSLNTTLTNYLFQSEMTYYISGDVGLYGTGTTFGGGTVLKYASGVNLTVNTPVTWLGKPYRPVVMMAKDDNSAGETISGSTGSPGNSYYAAKALYCDESSTYASLSITNLRVINAKVAVAINGSSGHTLCDLQLVKCANGIAVTNTDFSLNNALFDRVITNFTGTNTAGGVEHLTTDTAGWLNQNIGTNLCLTNCLLVGVTNLGSCYTQNVAVVSSSTGIFQTGAPGGFHYLATNSPYRNAGTTNIDPNFLAVLAKKTTYPPIIYSNTTFPLDTTFNPQAQRDSDIPDLGFHYDPLDYVFGGVYSNANLTFTSGTAVGWFRTSSGFRSHYAPLVGFGIHLADTKIADFQGTEEAPDYWARCNTVQEQDNSGGYGPGGIIGTDDQSNNNIALSAEVHMTFTRNSILTYAENHFRDDWGYLIIRARHTEFWNGGIGAYVISCYLTNCLMDRMQLVQVAGLLGDEWVMRNCTLHGGIFDMSRSYPMYISVRDSAFDGVSLSVVDSYSSTPADTDYDYNAYTNATDPFPIGGTHDQTSVNFDWQVGPLGTFYLYSGHQLVNAGSTTADQVGLYHFTTLPYSNTEEGNSTVDIGYHYVAVDDYGNPLDTDGDGTPDYIEDANGNGLVDSGETDWQSATDLGLKVIITRPRNNSVIP